MSENVSKVTFLSLNALKMGIEYGMQIPIFIQFKEL